MLGLGKLRRLWRIKSDASALYDLAEAAEADPRLYRTSSWWRQVLTTAAALVSLIPLATKERTTMNTAVAKVGAGAGLAAAVAGIFADPNTIGYLHTLAGTHAGGALHVIGLIGTIAAVLFGYLHPSPIQPTATDQPAK